MRNLIAIVACAAALQGCGKTSVEGADAVQRDTVAEPTQVTGCIQGVVINGLTGERLALPEANEADGKGIIVRVRDKMLKAVHIGSLLEANPSMKGEYALCGIPVEDSFPIYIHVDGFQPFASVINVASTVAQRSPKAHADLQKPAPTAIHNIRLYPVGQQTLDLKFKVLYASAPLKGAQVQIRPSNKNFLDAGNLGNFLAPNNGALLTLNATTDDNGLAAFPAAALALGGHYDYVVLPAAGALHTSMKKEEGTLVIGLLGAKSEFEPYLVTVNLDNTQPKLAVVSESREPNKDGIKTCTLNRPVELVDGTADGVTAALSGNVEAQVKAEVAGNNASESAAVVISQDGLTITLSPKWEKTPNLEKEPGLTVTYAGLQLKPRGTPDLMDRLDLTEACKLTVALAE